MPAWFCPLKVLEYRARGVPVVAAPVGDNPALVGDGGKIVSDPDPRAWAAAVQRAANRPSRPWVRSWDRVADEALAIPLAAASAMGHHPSPS